MYHVTNLKPGPPLSRLPKFREESFLFYSFFLRTQKSIQWSLYTTAQNNLDYVIWVKQSRCPIYFCLCQLNSEDRFSFQFKMFRRCLWKLF